MRSRWELRPGGGRDRFRPRADAHDGPCRCCGRVHHRPCSRDPAGPRDGPKDQPSFLGLDGATKSVGRSISFAGPLWLISIGTQLSLGTDVPIVGRFFGAVAAGSVCGSGRSSRRPLIRAVCANGLQLSAARPARAVDVAPRGPADRSSDCASGARLHGHSRPRTPDPCGSDRTAESLAVDVLRIYSLTWALNVPPTSSLFTPWRRGHIERSSLSSSVRQWRVSS